MKKNIKKFLGVFLSVLLIMLPILSTNVEKVEAEDTDNSNLTCETFTNYYFFLLVADPATTFVGNLTSAVEAGSSTLSITHASTFKTDFPNNPVNSSKNVTWIDIGSGQEGWDKEAWWDVYLQFSDLSGEGQVITDSKDSTVRYFGHISSWYLEGGTEKDNYTSPKGYTLEENLESTFTTTTSNSAVNTFAFWEDPQMTIGIKRTINVSAWQAFAAEQQDRYVNGEHPTDRNLWLPGLLKVTYEAECVEEEAEFQLTLHYEEDGTGVELQDPTDEGTYAEGETYSLTCPNTIGNYTLTRDSGLTGTMPANDVDEYCYYKLNEEEADEPTEDPTYKVTVNYIDEKSRQPLQDPKVTTGFKDGDAYLEECPDSLVNGTYIYDTSSGNTSGKIAGKDEVIYCIYTNENKPTSDIPIYIVWGVGGAALAYSVYYFRKYYKQENNA